MQTCRPIDRQTDRQVDRQSTKLSREHQQTLQLLPLATQRGAQTKAVDEDDRTVNDRRPHMPGAELD